MQKNIFKIIVFTLLLKLFYFAFALTVSKFDIHYHVELNTDEFISLFKRNDSYWYQKAADQGYPKITNPLDLGYSNGKDYKQSVWAHFPLYPLSIKFIEYLFNLDFNQSAFILSILFSITCFCAFYFLCLNVFKIIEHKSYKYTLFFILFPFHYYFSMYYTEALFFTLLAISFILISRQNYFLNCIILIFLSLVRPNGIISLIPLFIYFIETEGGFKLLFLQIRKNDFQKIKKGLYFLSGPIALGFYCLYQKQMTDHYFAYIKAQSGWYKEFMFPLFGLFRRSDIATQFNSIYTIIFMIISIVSWKKFSLSLNVLIWISLLLPLTSGSAACMPRYISIIFPLIIHLASFVVNIKSYYLVLIGIFILQLGTFYPWLISHPFSF
jgi:hypothetical protein